MFNWSAFSRLLQLPRCRCRQHQPHCRWPAMLNCVSDPYSLNPKPEPGFLVNPVTILGFWWQIQLKNIKFVNMKYFHFSFLWIIFACPDPDLELKRPNWIRIRKKHWFCLFYSVSLCSFSFFEKYNFGFTGFPEFRKSFNFEHFSFSFFLRLILHISTFFTFLRWHSFNADVYAFTQWTPTTMLAD